MADRRNFGIHMAAMNQRWDFAQRLNTFCMDGVERLEKDFPEQDFSKQPALCAKNMGDYLASETPARTVLWQSCATAVIIASIAWLMITIAIVVIQWVLAGRRKLQGPLDIRQKS